MRLLYFFVGLLCVFRPLTSALANGAEYPALLGNGYDTLKLEHKMSQCVEGKIIKKPHVVYQAEFTKVENWSQLLSEMNFSVPGSIILSSDSELAKFALRARDTRYTSTYMLKNHVSVLQELITNPKISIQESDPLRFREECGTEFVSEVTRGGKLHVAIKFSFSDFEFKQEFDAGGSLNSITGLGAHVDALSSVAKKNSSVEIFFHQVGGNLDDLNNMFESGDIVHCSLEHFDKCENLLKAVWNYSKDRFSKSVKDGGMDQTISFQTDRYLNKPHLVESEFTKKERKKLVDILDDLQWDRDFLYSLKGERLEQYENCDDRCLTMLISAVTSNMRTLRDAIQLSFEDPDLFKEQSTLEKLELKKVEMPHKKTDYHLFIMSNLNYLIPTGLLATVVPIFLGVGRFCGTVRPALN
jgi:hypothetical protein